MEEKENKRSFRARFEHKQLMLEEAEENPVIITMNFSQPNARAQYNKCWAMLTNKLNCLGYGEKSQDKWRRVLIDWISATKSKYSKIKKDREQTGGGPHGGVELSSIEERLMAIKGFTCVEGDATTPEICLWPPTTNTFETSSSSEVTSTPTIAVTPTEQSEVIIVDIEESNETPRKIQKKDHSSKSNIIKTLPEMHEETLQELRNINSGIQIIAECMVNISNTFKNTVSFPRDI